VRSKSVLIVAVCSVSALSVGAGTFLAYRANQTATPIIEATSASSPAPQPPELSSPSQGPARSAPVTGPAPVSSQAERPVARRDATAGSRTGAPVPVPNLEPVTRPATPPAPLPVLPVETPPVTAAAAATSTVEPPPAQEPPKPRFEDVTVKDAVIGIRIDQAVSSETAQVEDRITAKVTRDVTVDGRTVIATGTKLEGFVTIVERGGKFRERAKLGIRFNTLILADGLRVPIQTEAILREGQSPSNEAGSKIGASAVAGAILGGLIGGKRGAVIGSTAGAAGGTAAVAAGGRNEAIIASGAPLTVRLTAPVTITIERELEVR
jgi:hypothetical protein